MVSLRRKILNKYLIEFIKNTNIKEGKILDIGSEKYGNKAFIIDFKGYFVLGNIFKESLKEIYRSKKYNGLRKLILNKKINFCNDCDLTNQKFTGEFIKI